MRLPEGYDERDTKIAKLKKAIYGTKQASRCWNKKFLKALTKEGFVQSKIDPCVFVRVNKDGSKTLVGVFVDDVILAGKEEDLKVVREIMMSLFKMRDLGKLAWILGIKIERDSEKLQMSQEVYTEAVLVKFGMQDSKPVLTPLPTTIETTTHEAITPFDNVKLYQKMIGALIYLSDKTRPDITYSVNFLASKMSAPTIYYFNLAKRVMRYLNGTRHLKLTFNNRNAELIGYSDASYAEDKIDRRSTSGFAFMKNGAAISWKSKKQKIVTLSSMEAEYVALTNAAKEGIYLRNLSNEHQPTTKPMVLYEDNQSAIKTAENKIHNERSKHIDVRYHFIREQVEQKKFVLKYIPTTDQIADIFTKPLGNILHYKFTTRLGLL
jgi:hypothetical protein